MLKKRFSNKKEAEEPETGNEKIVEPADSEMNDSTGQPVEDREDATGKPAGSEAEEIPVTVAEEFENADEPQDDKTTSAALQKALTESQDKYLRLAAEFDNYRKRTLREKMELIQNAGESLLKDILPVVDDFERGIEVVAKAEDMDAVRLGMDLIYQKLKDFLVNHGLKEINAMNEPFDADWHEAVTNFPAPSEDMKGKIIDVIQKGYTLNDKVIRFPKVVVGE